MKKGFNLLFNIIIVLTLVISTIAAMKLLVDVEYINFFCISAIIVFLASLGIYFNIAVEREKSGKYFSLRLIIYGMLVILILIISGYTFYNVYSKENYLVEKDIAVVTIKDIEGKTGHFECIQQIKILKSGLNTFWDKELASTGYIVNLNVQFVDLHIKSQEIYPRAGLYDIKTVLLYPLNKGQSFKKIIIFDIVESKPEDVVYAIHKIEKKTLYLEISIILPNERPCIKAEAESKKDEDVRQEISPSITKNGTYIRFFIDNPELGREYMLKCNW